MSFTTTNPWVQYAGNDSTTEFAFNHKTHDEGDVVVLLTVDATNVTTIQTIATHYTVADVAEDAHDGTTPTITMITPPATGETLTMYRQVDLIMDTDFGTNEFWQALPAEKQNELVMMAVQWLYLLVSRCAIGSLASDPVTTTLEEMLVAIGILPISSLPAKTTPVDADVVRLGDSEDSDADKKLSLDNLWAYISGKVSALYLDIATYDPGIVGGDVFDMDNMAEGTAKILTAAERAEIAANTTHSGGDGSDHADVATNTTHSGGDGTDHAALVKGSITVFLDATSTGAKQVYLKAPCAGTITKMTIFGDTSGSAVVDIWKDTYANFPPTVADTIIGGGGTKPTLSTAQKNQDSTLTDWALTFTENDIFEFNIDSSDLTKVIITLDYDKTGV